MRRTFALLTMIALLSGLATAPAFADLEDAIEDGDAGVRLLTPTTAAVTRGDDGWVALNWTAFGSQLEDVEDFEVTLRKNPPRHVDVAYSDTTVDHASLWDNDVLSVGEVDYTALHIDVGEDYNRNTIRLRLVVSYTADGQRFSDRHNITVPVVDFSGQPIEQVTDDWGTANAGDAAWYEIAFAGQAPAVTDFSVVVTEPSGMVVTYPQGTHTSLHFDDVLESRETDVVRLYIETAGMVAGEHTLTVECNYTYEGRRITETDTLTITITAP